MSTLVPGDELRTTSSSAVEVTHELARDVGGRTVATRSSAAASWSNGCRPGIISVTSQDSEPASAPRPSAGTSPALTTDDLPMPDGPTTTSSRSLFEHRDHLGDGTLATVEVLGVGLLEWLEAAVRVAGRHERSRGSVGGEPRSRSPLARRPNVAAAGIRVVARATTAPTALPAREWPSGGGGDPPSRSWNRTPSEYTSAAGVAKVGAEALGRVVGVVAN